MINDAPEAAWSHLAERWQLLAQSLALGPSMHQSIWQKIQAAYSEPHRAYHNSSHIHYMFHAVDQLANGTVPTAVSLAVWFHDLVYDPRRDDNETASAEQLRVCMDGLVETAVLSHANRLILLTRTHEAGPDDLAAHLLLDADLSILGADVLVYEAYAAAIRQEYAHVPEPLYRSGRTAVLQRFLRKPFIFLTPKGQHLWETQARANVQREIALLSQPE